MATQNQFPQPQQGFMSIYGGQQMQPGTGPLLSSAGATHPMRWDNLSQGQNALTNNMSPAQQKLQSNFTPKNTGFPSYADTTKYLNGMDNPGQTTEWGWGGEGGKAATLMSGIQTVGNLYMANEARKLGAADLDFRKQSFNDQYASQRSLVNDQLFDRQRRRNLELGMGSEAAGSAADEYVKNRGVA